MPIIRNPLRALQQEYSEQPKKSHSPIKWVSAFGRFVTTVTKHVCYDSLRDAFRDPQEKKPLRNRTIQHFTSKEQNDEAYTLMKAHRYEKKGQFMKAAWLRAKAGAGIYEEALDEKWNHYRHLRAGSKVIAGLGFEGAGGKLQVEKNYLDSPRSEIELDLLDRLDHPNIVKALPNPRHHFRMHNGGQPLLGLIPSPKNSTAINPDLYKGIAKQLVDTLAYLKQEQVMHRDINPEHIVIDQAGHITLINFGISYDGKTDSYCDRSGVGTQIYRSPEISKHKKRNPQLSEGADVFAAGQTLLSLLTGSAVKLPPFRPKKSQTEEEAWDAYSKQCNLPNKVADMVASQLPNESPEYVTQVTDLLARMLEPNPKLRITPEELQKHPLFTS